MTPPHPRPPLIDDGYLVEPEPVDPPAPLGLVRWGCGVCLGIWLAALVLFASTVLDAAPRSGQTTIAPPRDMSELRDDRSAGLIGAPRDPSSGQPELGAPSSIVSGWATWCAPTATQCQSWGGDALLGAMPTFHDGDRRYPARVCTAGGECVAVQVVSFCACRDRHGRPTVIDLSRTAFEQLAPASQGVIEVTVEVPVGLPATDTGGKP